VNAQNHTSDLRVRKANGQCCWVSGRCMLKPSDVKAIALDPPIVAVRTGWLATSFIDKCDGLVCGWRED